MRSLISDRKRLVRSALVGALVGIGYGCAEYSIKLDTIDEQEFLPLLVRATIASALIITSVEMFEICFRSRFARKRFGYLVLVRTIAYVLIISVWLFIMNALWYSMNARGPVGVQLYDYVRGNMFLINLVTIISVVAVLVGLGAINSLHRKGELVNFILGRYHQPREVQRVFCFIDLKDSTQIAERLGNFRYARFLQDYYADLTPALRSSQAQVYQYIGDEIVLSWSFDDLKEQLPVKCYFHLREIFQQLRPRYEDKYGIFPEFRAGIHGGQVIVTWVGELKKEIVYIGDHVNTAARIREDCKRLGKEVLISDEILHEMPELQNIRATFVEETIPRGKAQAVRLFSLEKVT